jgi:hypothetical protein
MSDRIFPVGTGLHVGPRLSPQRTQHQGPGGGFRHGLKGGGWGTTGWGWGNWSGWWPVSDSAIGGCVWTLLGEVQPGSAPPADWPADVTSVALDMALHGTESTAYYQSPIGYFRLRASAGSCLVAVCQSASGYLAAGGDGSQLLRGLGAPHVGPTLTPVSSVTSGTNLVTTTPATAPSSTPTTLPPGPPAQYFAPAIASTTNTGLVVLGLAVVVLGLGGFAYLVHQKHLQDQGAA